MIRRHLLVVLVAVLCTVAPPASAQSSDDPTPTLAITDVTVLPEPPAVGDEFTVRASISNPTDGVRFDVLSVRLSNGTDDPERQDVTSHAGWLLPGETETVTLRATIDRAGTHRLAIAVVAETERGKTVYLHSQRVVSVGGTHPGLDVSVADGVVTAETTVAVNVSNGLTTDVRDLRVRVAGDSIDVRRGKRLRARLASGRSASFEFPVVPTRAGLREVRATVTYTGADGTRRTLREATRLRVDPASALPTPTTSIDAGSLYARASGTIEITVANGLDAPVRSIETRMAAELTDVLVGKRVRSHLDAGEHVTFAFPVVPERAGRETFSITTTYVDSKGVRRTLRRNRTVRIDPATEAPAPGLAIEVNESIVGIESSVRIRVANGLETPLRDLDVRLQGADFDPRNPRRIRSGLDPGESASFSFAVTPRRAGENPLRAVLHATVDGDQRTVRRQVAVTTRPVRERVRMEVDSTEGGSGVAVTLFNFGNVPVRDAVVRTNLSGGTTLVGDVPDGTSRTVRLYPRRVGPGEIALAVTARYAIGDRTGRITETARPSVNRGRIELTGVRVAPDGGSAEEGTRVHVSGSTSNVGLTEAKGVLVEVLDVAGVVPAAPNRDYFVGVVPESDFASFDVYAHVEAGVTEVPLRVSYLVDGERRSAVVSVPYDHPSSASPTTGNVGPSATSSLLAGGVGIGLAIVVLGIVYVGWRNRGE